MIAENGRLLANRNDSGRQPQIIASEIDLEHLAQEKNAADELRQAVMFERPLLRNFRTVTFPLENSKRAACCYPVLRTFSLRAFGPARARNGERGVPDQVQGLAKRLQASQIERVVIGISGGLDSTQALLVCAQCMDVLGHPSNQYPRVYDARFATSKRTLEQAPQLMTA